MKGNPKSNLTNEEIMWGLHARDTDLVSRLIEEYGGRLSRYLLLLTGNRSVAEDIFQETWVRVLERGYQYKGTFGFQAWLLSIARHLVIDQSRQKRTLSLEDLGSDEQPFDAVAESAVSPLERLCREERQRRIDSQVRHLPPTHRKVLLHRVDDEMLLAEIAETMAVPLSTVKGRLYRAMATLQARLHPASRSAEFCTGPA